VLCLERFQGCLMLVENKEIFLYTSAFENFTIMDICVVSFLYMLSPQGEFCIWKHMLI